MKSPHRHDLIPSYCVNSDVIKCNRQVEKTMKIYNNTKMLETDTDITYITYFIKHGQRLNLSGKEQISMKLTSYPGIFFTKKQLFACNWKILFLKDSNLDHQKQKKGCASRRRDYSSETVIPRRRKKKLHVVSRKASCTWCTSSYNGGSAGLLDSKQVAVQIWNTIQHLCHNTQHHTSLSFFICMFHYVQACKDILLSLCIILCNSLSVLCSKSNKRAELYEYIRCE
jgi:hypothetical protein